MLDFEDKVRRPCNRGRARESGSCVNRSRRRIWARCLGEYLGPGDLLIDLAWNIDCCEILQWCHDHGVLYINTSVEVWDPYDHYDVLAPHAADALLAASEPAPAESQLVAAGSDRRDRTRGQSGPDLALYQAGPVGYRRTAAG